MAPTSVLAYMDILASTVRTWFVGVTHHRVRMGERAGRQELLTAAGVRPAGWDFTVTSQVFPVRWLPNREELMSPICVITRVSVWMQEMSTTASARLVILGVTVRSRWMNALPIPVRTELPALTF